MPIPMRALIPELEDIIHQEIGDGKSAKPMVNPKKVFCKGFPKELIPPYASDPIDALEKIVERAVFLMSNTIDALESIKAQVNRFPRDKTIASFPSIPFYNSLASKMNIDVANVAAYSGDGPGKVGLVIRWLKNMRDLLKSGDLRYECLSKDPKGCENGNVAWVFRPLSDADLKDPKRPDFYHIHLCRKFWTAEITGDPTADITKTQLDFQALIVIHEVSHIYYSSRDEVGKSPWVAECVAQFVGETNGVTLNPGFTGRCRKP
jgi:hypothetical protein